MPDDRWLSATEAIARLGVKPQTLYAYVSRGLIRRERPAGSRTSRYARRDVERLAGHGRARPGRPGPEIVDRPGDHRPRPGRPPRLPGLGCHPGRGRRPLRAGRGMALGHHLRPERPLDRRPRGAATAREVQAALPAATPLPDRLRVAVAALRAGDPLRDDRRVAAVAARAGTLLATLVEALPPVDPRDAPSSTGSLARRLWTRVSPLEPMTRRVRALDRALSLLADHELATSTLAVRVAASAWADPYLLLLTGLATVGRTAARRGVGVRPRPSPRRGGHRRRDGRRARHARRRARARVRSRGLRGSRSAGAGAARRDRGEPSRPATSGAPLQGVLDVMTSDGRAARQRGLRARCARRDHAHGRRCRRGDLRHRRAAQAGSHTASRSTSTGLRYRIRATYTGPELVEVASPVRV